MKRRLVYTGICIALIVLGGGILTYFAWGSVAATHEYQISKYYRFEPITQEGITQWIQPEYNYLDSIELFIADISSEAEGKLELTIRNEESRLIFKKKYAIAPIPTGEFYEYRIEKKLRKGERYVLQVSYDGDTQAEGAQPMLMVTERKMNLPETEEMLIGEVVQNINAAITYHYQQRSWFWL